MPSLHIAIQIGVVEALRNCVLYRLSSLSQDNWFRVKCTARYGAPIIDDIWQVTYIKNRQLQNLRTK